MTFELLDGALAICRLSPDATPEGWWEGGAFCGLTRTRDELSVVCAESAVPPGVRSDGGWRVLKLVGPFDLDAVGILAPVVSALAEADISMLPIATFDTDYLLLKQGRLASALECLRGEGHIVVHERNCCDSRILVEEKMARPSKLSDSEIREKLSDIPGWDYLDGALRREWTFPDFKRAFAFMTSVALAAEAADHHPDWSNVYNRVTMSLNTHDAGGVTTLDFELAAAASELAAGSR